ncbi:MAG: hypothetical protein HY813_02730 [Candidatus Portnoybacteria bacterium]|nr:hypothetical protein [Candidatus Portnoybacteria bacterium]
MWKKFTLVFWKKIFSWLGYEESEEICGCCGKKLCVKRGPRKKYVIKTPCEIEYDAEDGTNLETCLNPDCQDYTMIGTVLKFKFEKRQAKTG